MGSDEIKDLELRLALIKQRRSDKQKIKQLKKQIRSQEFAQTKTGRFIDVVGGFGEKMGKKILAPPKHQKGKKMHRKSIQEVIDGLPA